MSDIAISTRERREHKEMTNTVGKAPTFSVFGEPWHLDRRSPTGANERRVAKYRQLVDELVDYLVDDEDENMNYPSLIVALRREVTDAQVEAATRMQMEIDRGYGKWLVASSPAVRARAILQAARGAR